MIEVGSRVKIVTSATASPYVSEELSEGQTGRVVGFNGTCYEIEMDNGCVDDDGDSSWPFYAEELETIEEENK